MTPNQILEDIRSERKKLVILDGDYNGEIDDQYTLAYTLGCENIKILGVCASAQYEEVVAEDTEEVMLRAMRDVRVTYEALDLSEDELPLFEGARSRITVNEDLAPSDSPAARFIIECAHKYDEPIYVFVTGPCTNVVSACLIDPSIMDKIVVIWLCADCLDKKSRGFHEWNMYSDYAASQYLMNLPIPLIWLPCSDDGSVILDMNHDDLAKLIGTGKAADHLKRGLPLKIFSEERFAKPDWHKVMCDYMAPAVLSVPDAVEFEIIPAPVITDAESYATDRTRRKIIMARRPDNRRVIDDSIAALNRVIAERE
ncbi:MAG: nucleoside hydrolase [Clostridia bacterium]|nr:nucleoside hydrolase [Clostridia bacterium]